MSIHNSYLHGEINYNVDALLSRAMLLQLSPLQNWLITNERQGTYE